MLREDGRRIESDVDAYHLLGETTTLLLSPSPVLEVTTSEWSASVRWTIRLSYAGIGSSLNGTFLILTISAMRKARLFKD